MAEIFWVTCSCGKKFSVDHAIRDMGVPLECPYCREKFLVSEAKAVFERGL